MKRPPSTVRLPTGHQAGFLHSVSLSTILPGLLGAALLMARFRYVRILETLSPTLPNLLMALGVFLLVYSVMQGVWRQLSRRRGSSLMGREIVLLPREGMIFMLILLTLAAGALIGRSNLLMLVFALMAGPFVLNGLIVSLMLKRVRVYRRLPKRAMAGQPMSVQIETQNRKRLLSSRLIAVHDHISNDREALDPGVLFVCIPPNQSRRGTYTARLMQRGVYNFGPIYIASRFPLGLGERGRTANVSDSVIVHPRIGHLTLNWRQSFFQGTELVDRQRGRAGVFEDEFHRIREFRSGDNPRAIHWRTSARKNELMVREFEQNRDQNLCIMLDLFSDKPLPAEQSELAISFVATVCCEHIRLTRDSRIGLFVAGDKNYSIDGPSVRATMEIILDSLAKVAIADSDQFEELLKLSAAIRNTNSRPILITTRPEYVSSRIQELSQAADPDHLIGYETLQSIRVVDSKPASLLRFFSLSRLQPAETSGRIDDATNGSSSSATADAASAYVGAN